MNPITDFLKLLNSPRYCPECGSSVLLPGFCKDCLAEYGAALLEDELQPHIN
ncbi:MAG: hypothetical protein ACXWTU_00440 [Methylotenera sp.]